MDEAYSLERFSFISKAMALSTLVSRSLLGLTVVGAVGLCANPAIANSRLFVRRVTIAGMAPTSSDLDAAEARLRATRVALHVGARVESESLAGMGLTIDKAQSIAKAERASREGVIDHVVRLFGGEGHVAFDIPLSIHVDEAPFAGWIDRVKEEHDVPPTSARLDLTTHVTIKEKAGAYIDSDRVREQVVKAAAEAVRTNDPVIEISVEPVPFLPRLTEAFLSTIDVSTLVGEYETYFSRQGDQEKRGKNIDAAATRLNGVVLMPGELFSFNGVVGQRSEENGFQKSWEIFKGEMVEGVGGGTCQVASTFHAAAFFAGLDVLERLPHSRPSAYIPMGLDSTVVYPAVDLKIRNPHPFPIVIHAETIAGGKLHVGLYGAKRMVKVDFERELLEKLPFKRKLVEKPELRGNRIVRKQHGIFGYKIKRTRTIHYADGTSKKEEEKDTYPPTQEIFEVPIGFDESVLPSIPQPEEEVGEGGDVAAATAKNGEEVATAPPPSEPSPLTVIEAKGSHAPTLAQRSPPKTVSLRK